MRARQQVFRKSQTSLLVLLVACAFVAQTKAGANRHGDENETGIKNFGKMDDRFYRGAQPKAEDYKTLALMGIKIVFDLRNDPEDYAKQAAEAAGLRYINIPMSDKERPLAEQIASFLKIVTESGSDPFYVHCRGGRHRTGLIGAVYRVEFYHWQYPEVYKEMKAYDYYSRWGHGDIKEYVQEYCAIKYQAGAPAMAETDSAKARK